jgi:hypothetical protein
VMAPYVSEHEAPDKVARLDGSVDAYLFASSVPWEYARRAGVLTCPATCIQLGGTPLYAALLRARRTGIDPARASFDGVTEAEVRAGLADLGSPADGVHVREDIAAAAAIASFHERLWRLGQTSAAFTCVQQVARKLTAADVPVVALLPTEPAISSALQTATLLATNRALAESQLAVAVVEVPALRENSRRPAPRQAREELQLTVHRFLVREARRIQATVSPMGEHGFLVVSTRASLSAAGDPPFAASARAMLGAILDVAVGIGRTEHEAEAQARRALGRSGQAGALGAVYSPASAVAGLTRQLHAERASTAGSRPAADSLSRLRGLETLSKLAQKLAADSAPVVDAELTGQLLAVTPRTARRQLRALVDEGLALPLPPARRQHPGRPRQAYRLVVEKLDRRAAQ